jgi:hypothetical protein
MAARQKTKESVLKRPSLYALAALALFLILPRAASATDFTFTGLPVPFSYSNFGLLYAGASGVDLLRFEMDVTNAPKDAILMRLDFHFDGIAPPGSLTNFLLIFYSNGVKHPGTIVGINIDGAFNGTDAAVFLPTPMQISKNFKGVFALRADIPPNFTTSFFFTPSLASAVVYMNGVGQQMVSSSLPLTGDIFRIVQD